MIQSRRLTLPAMPRREVLRLGLAAVGLASTGQASLGLVSGVTAPAKLLRAEEPADPAAGYIDAHSHIWTPDVDKYPLAKGFSVEDLKPPSFTPEELFAHCKPAGVTRVVLIQMSFYGFDNSYMLDSMRRFPNIFSAVAVIDENDQPARTMRSLRKEGVRGFRIRPGNRPVDRWLDGAGMAEMWKCGAEENLAMCHLINPDSLPFVDKMCEKFPQTPVVVDHFARIGVDGQIRDADVAALCKLARHKRTSVKISAYYALGKKQAPYHDLLPMIRKLLDAYGPERLMWASDCPYQVQEGHQYAPSINLIKHADFLSEGDRQWLLRKTAEKVFFS